MLTSIKWSSLMSLCSGKQVSMIFLGGYFGIIVHVTVEIASTKTALTFIGCAISK